MVDHSNHLSTFRAALEWYKSGIKCGSWDREVCSCIDLTLQFGNNYRPIIQRCFWSRHKSTSTYCGHKRQDFLSYLIPLLSVYPNAQIVAAGVFTLFEFDIMIVTCSAVTKRSEFINQWNRICKHAFQGFVKTKRVIVCVIIRAMTLSLTDCYFEFIHYTFG